VVAVVTCSSCGAQAGGDALEDGTAADGAPEVPLGWMVEHDRARGRTFVCAGCVRRHARAIEAKQQAWW
jgi:hypothetical protein